MPQLCRPNILLVVFDSLSSFEYLSNEALATPTLDKLFAEGAKFTQAYTQCPESSPSRASLFTGLDPCVHGLWANGVSLPEQVRTLPEILKQSGYISWLIGRWQLAGVSNWTTEHIRPGAFDHIDWAHGPLHRSRQNAYLSWLQQNTPELYSRIFPSQPSADNTDISPAQRKAIANVPDDRSFNVWVGNNINQLISSHPSEVPFFAVGGMVVGDSIGSKPTSAIDCEALNIRALQQADRALQLIIERLTTDGRADDTVIIMTAARGSTEISNASDVMRERAIRVPLLIHSKDLNKSIVGSPVSTIDIAPTILDIAGLPGTPSMQGYSLLDVLNGSQSSRGWAMSRLRSGVTSDGSNWQSGFRTGNMKLVVSHGNPQKGIQASCKLFDLSADPEELEDLASNVAREDDLEQMMDLMIDARCALEDRTEPRIAKF